MALTLDQLDLRQIRYFLTVAETGGYAKAAHQLNITQQAVSAAISKLEKSIETKLFDRNQGGTRLTDAGKRLVLHARVLLHDAKTAAEEVWAVGHGELGNVRLGTADDPAGSVIPQAVYALSQLHPSLHVSIAMGLNRTLRNQLLDGALDVVVAAPAQGWQSDHELVVERLYATQLRFVCSTKHPLAKKESLTLEDLRNYPFIFPAQPAPIQNDVNAAFISEGIDPPSRFIYCDNYVSGPALLSYGDHIVPAHPGIVGPFLEGGLLVALPFDFKFGYRVAYLAYRRNALLNAATQKLIDLIRAESKKVDIDRVQTKD